MAVYHLAIVAINPSFLLSFFPSLLLSGDLQGVFIREDAGALKVLDNSYHHVLTLDTNYAPLPPQDCLPFTDAPSVRAAAIGIEGTSSARPGPGSPIASSSPPSKAPTGAAVTASKKAKTSVDFQKAFGGIRAAAAAVMVEQEREEEEARQLRRRAIEDAKERRRAGMLRKKKGQVSRPSMSKASPVMGSWQVAKEIEDFPLPPPKLQHYASNPYLSDVSVEEGGKARGEAARAGSVSSLGFSAWRSAQTAKSFLNSEAVGKPCCSWHNMNTQEVAVATEGRYVLVYDFTAFRTDSRMAINKLHGDAVALAKEQIPVEDFRKQLNLIAKQVVKHENSGGWDYTEDTAAAASADMLPTSIRIQSVRPQATFGVGPGLPQCIVGVHRDLCIGEGKPNTWVPPIFSSSTLRHHILLVTGTWLATPQATVPL